MSSISILFIAVIFVIGMVLFAAMGKIPWLGEILFALLFVIIFFVAIFTIYTFIVLIVSLIYSPAIIATMEEDTMGTVFQNYSITWSQPWRIFLYNLILIPLAATGVYIFKWFWLTSYKFIDLVFGLDWLMGAKLVKIMGWASNLVNPGFLFCSNGNSYGISTLSALPNDSVLLVPEYIAGTILAFVIFVLFMVIFSYGLSILSVGETIILTIIKKKSDDENLLVRTDRDNLLKDDLDKNNEEDPIENSS